MSDPIIEPACPIIADLQETIKGLKLDLEQLAAENQELRLEITEWEFASKFHRRD